MAIQNINVGANEGSNTGETVRAGFVKANANFVEIAAAVKAVNDALAALTAIVPDTEQLAAINAHITRTNNPHSTTAQQVGALPLVGGEMTGNIDMQGHVLKNVVAQHLSLQRIDLGTKTSGTIVADAAEANFYRVQVGGPVDLEFANIVQGESIMLEIVNGGSATFMWPGAVRWIKTDGTFTTSFAALGTAMQANGTDFVVAWSNGSTIFAKIIR